MSTSSRTGCEAYRLQATLPCLVPHTPQPHNEILWNSPYVFIRHDGVRKPLQPPYKGPFKVLDRNPKYFTIDVKGHTDTIAEDRLKPAHLDTIPTPTSLCVANATPHETPSIPQEDSWAIPPPTRTTRSGHRVH